MKELTQLKMESRCQRGNSAKTLSGGKPGKSSPVYQVVNRVFNHK